MSFAPRGSTSTTLAWSRAVASSGETSETASGRTPTVSDSARPSGACSASTVAGRKFIWVDPTNPATKRLRGRW